VYFGAENGNNGIELQVSDGTANGTKLLGDLNPGSSDSWPNNFISLGKKLLFWATSATEGAEPWFYIPPINVSTTAAAAACFGDSTGAVTLQISPDAAAPLSAVWLPAWVLGLEPVNLPAGTYSVTVTDADGATGTAIATVEQPNALSLSGTTTPEAGTAANGTVTADATGGTPAYSYLWNTVPPQTTETATNLAAGDYTCTVTDANGCMALVTATVTQTIGISEKATNLVRMTFQPNPAHTLAHWSVAGETAVSGRIMQANGQVIRNLTDGELAQGQLDTRRLSEGSYFLLVVLKNGQSAYAQFVVAQ
jgi:ELWxxDGT repeat protein